MPHSSGGGSHGGGSHGGSSHSSYGGGGSSVPARHVSHNKFKGASTYVYYSHNKPHFVYADYDVSGQSGKGSIVGGLIALSLALLFLFLSIFYQVTPEKLNTRYRGEKYGVIDNIGIFDGNVGLESSLKAFYDKTGVAPYVITVNNEDWKNRYRTLENYAYDLYVNKFDDESHWLIVYSEPRVTEGDFVDWYWEGMQGDDTDEIIRVDIADRFNYILQKNLTKNSKYTVEEAIKLAFDDVSTYIMDPYSDDESTSSFLFMSIVAFIFTYSCLREGLRNVRYKKAVRCTGKLVQQTCAYCGGIYIVGTCTTCPHCGAPLTISNGASQVKM